jgi:hypothetical protein
MTDRRAVARQRTFLGGLLSFQNGTASEDCVVRNFTAQGAEIELPHPRAPESFELLVPARGLRASARIAWRRGGRFGLALEPVEVVKPASKPALRDEGY